MWPFRKEREKQVVPPVNLDTPVTNPALLAAMSNLGSGTDPSRLDTLILELNRAVYLVATLLDQASAKERSPGEVTFEKGSLIKMLEVVNSSDHRLLPLFTDWDAIRKWTDESVSSMVMPAEQAWEFALAQYRGVVINPAGPMLELNRDQLEDLRRRGRPAFRPWIGRTMLKVILILALVGAAADVWALDGRSVGPLEGGTQLISHSGTKDYSAQVLFKRVHETPPIDFEKGTVALSPAKAATLAHDALSKHFPDVKAAHIEEVNLQTYKIGDGQYGFYVVKFVGGQRKNQQTFLIPVLLDGQVVVPEAESK